jgi:phosphoribosylanthranilate isomerase
MVRVKICGITNVTDALMVADAGADALGFVFVEGSSRYVDPVKVSQIRRHLPPSLCLVGVFADSPLEMVRRIKEECQLTAIQLHGCESPAYCASMEKPVIKAFRINDQESLVALIPYQDQVEALLLDSFHPGSLGGTGKTFDWSLARRAKRYGRVILSGGLTPWNVAQAIERVRPYAVDVSSGVEDRPGKKDEGKVRRFLEEVQRTKAH